ncbi:uncharacterized protein LOC142232277 isoform X1 [Haematobia irritans]|uniref:uncharacterized protein LOC142232277 isoform X1 n=2 Tax=Haematobia irritans TaxID=7368 RepID=UPI003F4FB3D2
MSGKQTSTENVSISAAAGKTNNKNSHKNKKTIKKSLKSKTQKIKTNNNSNSNANSNNNNNDKEKIVVNDEIIEEFDFSDSDLAELNVACGDTLATIDNSKIVLAIEECEEATEQSSLVGGNLKEACRMQPNTMNISDNEQVEETTPAADAEEVTTDNNDKHEQQQSVTAVQRINQKEEESSAPITKNVNETEVCDEEYNGNNYNNNDNSTQDISKVAVVDIDKTHSNEKPPTMLDLKSKHVNDANSAQPLTAPAGNGNNSNDNDDNEYIEGEPYDELLVQFLDEANNIAEARLAARRQARAEAREIRMRELERQQQQQELNADRAFDMHTTASGIDPLSRTRLGMGSASPAISGLLNSSRGANSMSSRRSSEDSLEEEGRSLRDIRHELKDVEERFRKAMIANAQLDNERASQTYQIQLLKDKLEDMEESYAQLQREFKEKSRDCNALKRSLDKLSEELKLVQGQLNERDTLIAEQGLVIVAVENEDGTDAKRALVSVENAQLLGSVQGSLDVRLKKFTEEKQQLQSEVQQLQEQLETYKSQGKGRGRGSSSNGPLGSDDDDYEAQREANKIISDYKYKLQKAEQEIASLQSSLARSETQVIRYKSTAEAAEKAEAELKIERRKLQRENREAMEKLEELETSNNHLIKRLDKLKNAKSALLKDL